MSVKEQRQRGSIGIIDYDTGNLGSVEKALAFLGYHSFISNQAEQLRQADGLILPGVGAVSHAMNYMRQQGLDRLIHQYIDSGRPFLGICLGMQMLFTASEEGDDQTIEPCLNILPGQVVRFVPGPGLKVPQMGWNSLEDVTTPLLRAQDFVYFIHGYHCVADHLSDVAATTHGGISYVAAVAKENLTATQFHPEKSGEVGLAFLNRWAKTTLK